MRIAITGSKGQLGLALQQVLTGDELLLIDLPEHDITDMAAMCAAAEAFRPEVVIHGAAITNVDGCEADRDLAYGVNVLGSRNMALAAERCGAALIYISTDYVFPDGEDPYWEYDPAEPLNWYGRTKWYGELAARDLVRRLYVVRTSWVYGQGPRNFVQTVLRLARERGTLQMVTDEIGSPTYALELARALNRLMHTGAYGIYHLTGAGTCSRYEWTLEILRQSGLSDVPVEPTTDYPRAARVPKHVMLRSSSAAALGITMPDWQASLREYLSTLRDG